MGPFIQYFQALEETKSIMDHLRQKLKKVKGGYQEVQIVNNPDMDGHNPHSDSDIPLDGLSDNEN